MKKVITTIAVIAGFVLLIVFAFVTKEGTIAWNKHFKPKEENVRREVFLQTRSYNEAKLQELSKYRLEYLKAKASGDHATRYW